MIARRITTAPAGSWVEVAYSSWSPFSRDNRWLILNHQSHFHLYTGNGDYVKALPVGSDTEPRWSADPDVLYYIPQGPRNELHSFNVVTMQSRLVRKFAGSQFITGKGESDLSEDGRHLVLSDEKEIWVYDVETDRVDSFRYTRPFNSLYISADNHVLIGTVDRGVRFPYNGSQVAPTISHMDVGRDEGGREVLIRTNSADPEPIDNCPNGIEKVDLATGNRTCLMPVDWTYAVHISCPDRLPWCIVSTYSPTNSKPSQVIKVNYDGGHEVICDTGSVMIPVESGIAYNPQPRAAVSRDGSRLVFNSNAGDLGRGPNYCDVFMVVLNEVVKPVEPLPGDVVTIGKGWRPMSMGSEWLLHFRLVDGKLVIVAAYDKEEG